MFEITSHVIRKTTAAVPALAYAREAMVYAATREIVPGISGLDVYRSIRLPDSRPMYRPVLEFIEQHCGELLERWEQEDDTMMGGRAERLLYLFRSELENGEVA